MYKYGQCKQCGVCYTAEDTSEGLCGWCQVWSLPLPPCERWPECLVTLSPGANEQTRRAFARCFGW